MADEVSKIVDRDGKHMLVCLVDGIPFPVFTGIRERLKKIKSWTPRADDIFLFAYPSSGTHWLWEVVGMLLRGKAERIKVEKEHYMLECSDPETLEKLESPRILNSHIYKEQVPTSILQNNKIVLISRNPKDIAVSWYNHNVADLETDYEGKFSAFYELYRVGNVPNGDWFEYNTVWWKWSRDRENVLWVTYEEAKRDLPSLVEKMAVFLEVSSTPELCQSISDSCSFQKMKQDKHNLIPCELRENMSFYRKGHVGDWKNWFTVAQNEDYDRIFKEKMKDCDLPVEFTI